MQLATEYIWTVKKQITRNSNTLTSRSTPGFRKLTGHPTPGFGNSEDAITTLVADLETETDSDHFNLLNSIQQRINNTENFRHFTTRDFATNQPGRNVKYRISRDINIIRPPGGIGTVRFVNGQKLIIEE